MLQVYQQNLETLKRVRRKKEDVSKPNVVDLTELVEGLREYKLRHWFQGKHVTALKVRLRTTKKGGVHLPRTRTITIDGKEEEITFSAKDFSVCFAEPGEKELNAFQIPGFAGQHNLRQILGEFGIIIDPNADLQKLPKRLKRALLVATYAASIDVEVRITPDDALPEKFIDGCFLINLKKAQKIVKDAGRKEKLKAYDTIQASLAWSEGLAKGTAILMPGLAADVIVQECNIKREVRFNGAPLLAIEGFHHARTPCSDLQTMGNLMATKTLERVARAHLTKVGEIADKAECADAWFTEEFKHHDWYQAAVRAHLQDGKPMPKYKPPLTIARESGIKKISQTPVLKEVTFKHACKTLDIRQLKARFPHGEAVAGYLIPDVSRIDKNGYLQDSKEALQFCELRAPREGKHRVKVGPAILTRNPNAWGEALLRQIVDTGPKYRSRTAVQLGLDEAEAGISLAVWGGADMDDGLSIWTGRDVLDAFASSEEERHQHDIDRVDLEQYIDAVVQDASGFDLNLNGQMLLATRPLPMHLGQIVNFFMNLRICRQYDWYRKAAACGPTTDENGKEVTAVENLKKVYDLYNTVHPIWADIFCPDWDTVDEYGIDSKARVPRHMGEYIAHTRCLTDMGDVVHTLSDIIADMLECERDTNILHNGARVCTMDGTKWLIQQAEQQPSKIRAVVLEWGWKALTARNPIDALCDDLMKRFILGKMDFKLRDDRSWEGRLLKQVEWGKLCGRVLTGNKEWDREIVAYLGVLLVGYGRHWDREKQMYANKYGIDSIMWNPSFDQDGVVLKRGVPEIWASLMRDFEIATSK